MPRTLRNSRGLADSVRTCTLDCSPNILVMRSFSNFMITKDTNMLLSETTEREHLQVLAIRSL